MMEKKPPPSRNYTTKEGRRHRPPLKLPSPALLQACAGGPRWSSSATMSTPLRHPPIYSPGSSSPSRRPRVWAGARSVLRHVLTKWRGSTSASTFRHMSFPTCEGG